MADPNAVNAIWQEFRQLYPYSAPDPNLIGAALDAGFDGPAMLALAKQSKDAGESPARFIRMAIDSKAATAKQQQEAAALEAGRVAAGLTPPPPTPPAAPSYLPDWATTGNTNTGIPYAPTGNGANVDLLNKLKSVGYTDDMLAQMNPTEFLNALKQWGFAPATGTGAGNGLTSADDVARAEALRKLIDPNYGALVPMPDGTTRLNGTTTIIDTRVGGDLAPVSGIPDLFYDKVSKQFVDRSGNKIQAGQLAETIRNNTATQQLSQATLAETQRANMASEALKGQDLAQQQANTIAALYANPGNFVQREYMVRGLTPPSGDLSTNYTGPAAAAGGGLANAATGSNVPAGGIAPASGLAAKTPQGTYPTLAQTILNPQSNPNWLRANPVVDTATGTDPRLGATGSTRSPANAQALGSMMAQEWNATHPNQSTLPQAQMGAAGIANTGLTAGHYNYDPQHGWQFTPDVAQQGGYTFNPTTQQWGQDNFNNPGSVAPTDSQPDVAGLQAPNWTPIATDTSGVQTAGGFSWNPDPNATGGIQKLAQGGTTLAKSFIAGDPQQGQPTGNPELVNINDPTHDATASVTPLNDQQQMGQGIPPDGQPMPMGGNAGNGEGLAKLMASILVEISNQWAPQGGLAKYAYGTDVGLPDYSSLSNMGFRPTSNADIQGLPSIGALQQGYSQGRGLSTSPTFNAGFGAQLPEARGINYGGYLRLRQDPTSYGLLSSLYNSGSRNLDSEASIARQFAPFGNAQQRIRT